MVVMTSLKIEKMYAFVAKSEDGDEGILALKSNNGWLPMVGADFKRIESLLPIAEELTKASGIEFKILQFDNRIDVTEQFKKEPIKAIIQRYVKNNKGATKEEIMKYLNEGPKIIVPEKDIDEILMEGKT